MEDIETLYGELFDLFYDSKWANDELAAFKMQVGDNYENGPLFIGRATNGWTPFCPKEWNRESFIQNPMLPGTDFSDWLANNGNDNYKISRSQFWQDAKKIFDGLYNGNFSTDIAYSNFCKIARPAANPTDKQCFVQLEVCRRILLAEVSKLSPKSIILMTGRNGWSDWFFSNWNNNDVSYEVHYGAIKAMGYIGGCPFVVIHHPGRTQNRGDTRDEAVKAVIEHFRGYNE